MLSFRWRTWKQTGQEEEEDNATTFATFHKNITVGKTKTFAHSTRIPISKLATILAAHFLALIPKKNPRTIISPRVHKVGSARQDESQGKVVRLRKLDNIVNALEEEGTTASLPGQLTLLLRPYTNSKNSERALFVLKHLNESWLILATQNR